MIIHIIHMLMGKVIPVDMWIILWKSIDNFLFQSIFVYAIIAMLTERRGALWLNFKLKKPDLHQ